MDILMQFFKQKWWGVGNGVGVVALSGGLTLTSSSAHFHMLDPNGSNRDITLPSIIGPRSAGQWYFIRNSGSANNIVVKKGATTVATLTPGQWALIVSGRVSGSNDWYVVASVTALAALTLTGTLTAVAGIFTGRLTTTDGVTSGDARIVGGNVHTKVTATTISNSAVEGTFASHTLPANMLKAGTTLRVRGSVRVTGNAAADTLLFKLRLGGTAIVTTTAVAMVANDVARFDFMITSREAPGGTSEVAAEGNVTISVAGVHATKGYVLAPADYATNGALAVDLRGTWSAASASDIAICESFVVDVVA